MTLVLCGLSHHTAGIAVRERVAVAAADLEAALHEVAGLPGVGEVLLLSTCNRTEILAVAEGGDPAATLRGWLVRRSGLAAAALEPSLYMLTERDATRHLFRVAAGLDAQVLGEPQILHQVKAAHRIARREGRLGPRLEALCQRCFQAARRVRRDTDVGRHAISIAHVAVALARTIFGDLGGRRVLLLGSGKMSELAARQLIGSGVGTPMVSSRTLDHGVALAGRIGGEVVPWGERITALLAADIVVTTTAAPEPVLLRNEIAGLMRRRRHRPIFFIDLALPRDVEPSANTLEGVYVYDLDDLQRVSDGHLEERRQAARAAEAIVESEVAAFEALWQARAVGPTIAALRQALHARRERELARWLAKRHDLSPEQAAAFAEFTRVLVNALLHRPAQELRHASAAGRGVPSEETIRRLFGLAAGGEQDPGSGTPDEVPPPVLRVIRGGGRRRTES